MQRPASSGSRRLRFEELEARRLLALLHAPYYPADIRDAYGVNLIKFGSVAGNGAGQTIAILGDANDINSRLPADLAKFDSDSDINLPAPPSFTIVQTPGTPAHLSDPTGGNEEEEDLDIEWAHALAPGASIILVEAADTALDAAAQYAAGLPGVSVVSSSFGYAPSSGPPTGEYSTESQDDADFTTPAGHQGVTFVASSGDESFGSYAAFSPNVVAAGGTTLLINADDSYRGETYWDSDSADAAGAGLSKYESEPAYQQSFQSSGSRSVPDLSFDSDPDTGVWVYSGSEGWIVEGGTSLAAPALAGLFAIVDQGRVLAGGTTLDGPSQTLPALYGLPASDFNAMTTKTDIAGTTIPKTGLGSPKANLLVPDLAAFGLADKLGISSGQPTTVVAGTTFQFTVAAEDSFGGIDHTASGTVLVNGVAQGTLTAGVATISLSLDLAATGVVLQFSGDGLSGQSASFSVVAASASQLIVSSEPPPTVEVGGTFGLTVTAEDPFGNVATMFAGPAVVALGGNSAGATLGGMLSQPFSGGSATFSNLSFDAPEFGYTLQITSQSLPAVTTSPIAALKALTIIGGVGDNVNVQVIDPNHYDVTVNGTTTDYSTFDFDQLIYNGPTNGFSELVFDDPSGAYLANQSFASTELLGGSLAFIANDVANLYVYAGSGSTATVQVDQGSGGNFFVAAANAGYSYIADPVDGIFSQLIGFGAEVVAGSGGSTYAYIYSATAATIVGDPKGSTLTVGGLTSSLGDFSQMYVVGAIDGSDQVTIDSEGGAFVGTPSFSSVQGTLNGASFIIGALYCANVTAQASTTGTDTAFFYSYAQNTFNGSPTLSSLTGTTQTAATENGSVSNYAFTVQASGYDSVSVLESGSGTDVVNLASPGSGVFIGTSTVDTLTVGSSVITVNTYISTSGSSGTVLLPGPSDVTVTGNYDGTDAAFLYDSPGSNALVASGSTATLTTAGGTLTVNDFGGIIAEQQNGSSDTLAEGAIDFALNITGNWTSA